MSVYVPVGEEWVDPSEWRPATAQELVAALQEEGVGEVVRRCDAHDDVAAWGNPDVCRMAVNTHDEAACVMEQVLVARIEGEK